ncbi:extracellular solute-binding protein [Streptomyces albus]|uniref:extracellular solute-binding protein n=1 Tax=Streptomyces albus TaxID=1888 RepID=UPI0013B49BD5|nr:extracellular solute-binding protein [Streptomyces albus]
MLFAAVAVGLAGCAPSTSGGGGDGKDAKSGTLRVWLFREVGNQPKEKVVSEVVDRFEKRHEGVKVDVQYIPVDSRAERIKGAFNDPASAPDVIEYGNTDTAGYVADGGLADISEEFRGWKAAEDLDDTARQSVTVRGKQYGVPLFVGVQYIPVDSRAERIKGAFNDPASAPDVIEYGNTDTAGYVADGGLADISEEFRGWKAAEDLDDTARQSVTVRGKQYGVPLFVGVRALYYRTDIFDDLGLKPPRTLAELGTAARKIRAAHKDMYGIAVGGAYTYGAMPFIWAHGGALAAEKKDGSYASALDSAAAKKGITAYTSLFGDDNCPAGTCACARWAAAWPRFGFAGKSRATTRRGPAVGVLNRQATGNSKVRRDGPAHTRVVPQPGPWTPWRRMPAVIAGKADVDGAAADAAAKMDEAFSQ